MVGNEFSQLALRFLFAFGYGFSNRKQQLTMDYRPEFTAAEGVKRSTRWIASTFGKEKVAPEKSKIILQKSIETNDEDNVLRMG